MMHCKTSQPMDNTGLQVDWDDPPFLILALEAEDGRVQGKRRGVVVKHNG